MPTPPARLLDALDLILAEITDAMGADQILWGYIRYHGDLAAEPMEQQRVWHYMDQAVSWKLALAVNRLLQPPGAKNDRASVPGLMREIKAAIKGGYTLPRPDLFAAAETELARLCSLPEALELKRCRDEFMAHAILDGERKGMQVEVVRDLYEAVEQVVEDIYTAITGQASPLQDRYAQWSEWSDKWWRDRFPAAYQDSDPLPSPPGSA